MEKATMEGFVYVMTNPAMAELVKVGMTAKMPHLRAAEMSSHEGLPIQMQVEYWALVTGSARQVEKSAHTALSYCNAGKEWFKCDVHVAISAVRDSAGPNLQHEKFELADRAAVDREHKKREEQIAAEELRLETIRRAGNAKRDALESLTSEFHRLDPIVNQIISRPFFKYRLKNFPIEDIALLAQYAQVSFILSKADRYPKQNWLKGFVSGEYCQLGTDTTQEVIRRIKLERESPSFRLELYDAQRKALGV